MIIIIIMIITIIIIIVVVVVVFIVIDIVTVSIINIVTINIIIINISKLLSTSLALSLSPCGINIWCAPAQRLQMPRSLWSGPPFTNMV